MVARYINRHQIPYTRIAKSCQKQNVILYEETRVTIRVRAMISLYAISRHCTYFHNAFHAMQSLASLERRCISLFCTVTCVQILHTVLYC